MKIEAVMNRAYLFFIGVGILMGVVGARLFSHPSPPPEPVEPAKFSAMERANFLRDRAKTPVVIQVAAPQSSAHERAQAIIERLKTLPKDHPDNVRNRGIQLMLNLEDLGTKAVPAISHFLREGVDVNYRKHGKTVFSFGTNDPELEGATFSGEQVPDLIINYDFETELPRDNIMNLPEVGAMWGAGEGTMRTGLLFVLSNIGGANAEAALLEVLHRTNCGLEVASIGFYLEKLNYPKAWKHAADAALEILSGQPVRGLGKAEIQFEELCIGVLLKQQDLRFVPLAKQRLMNPKTGRMNINIYRYLRDSLGQEAVPIFADYWKRRPKNDFDRWVLERALFSYVGIHADADNVFRSAMNTALAQSDKSSKMYYSQLLQNLVSVTDNNLQRKEISISELKKRIQLLEEFASRLNYHDRPKYAVANRHSVVGTIVSNGRQNQYTLDHALSNLRGRLHSKQNPNLGTPY